METMDTLDNDLQEGQLPSGVAETGKTTAIWIKITAIAGLVGVSLQFINIFRFAAYNDSIETVLNILIYGLMLGLNITLLMYANSLAQFGNSNNGNDFTDAMNKQKTYWMFLGILLIILIILIIIAIVFIGNNYQLFIQEIMRRM